MDAEVRPEHKAKIKLKTSGTVPIVAMHNNVAQVQITITEDRLRLRIGDAIQRMAKRSEWQVPTGILATLVTTLMTVKFEDSLGQKADFWKALYSIGTALCVIWLLSSLRHLKSASSLETLINDIKTCPDTE